MKHLEPEEAETSEGHLRIARSGRYLRATVVGCMAACAQERPACARSRRLLSLAPMRIIVASRRSSSSFIGGSEAGGGSVGSSPKSTGLRLSACGCEPGRHHTHVCLASTLSLCLARITVRQLNPLRCDSCLSSVMFLGPSESCASSQSTTLLRNLNVFVMTYTLIPSERINRIMAWSPCQPLSGWGERETFKSAL